MTAPSWKDLVDVARWAPSPHNTQPWRLRPTGEREAVVEYVPARLLPRTDPVGRFQTMAQGIFVEALDIAASGFGYSLRVEDPVPALDMEPGGARPFIRISLQPAEKPGASDSALLRRRRTSRIAYDGQPVPSSITDGLEAIAAAFGHEASFTSDPSLVRWAVELNIETLFYDLRHRPAREELRLWIRKTDREARGSRDGFSPRCIGFNGRLIDAFFGHHRLFDLPGIRHVIRWTYARAYRGTATVGWIGGPQATPEDWFQTGRMLLRFWLACTEAGLVLHPFGSVITNPQAQALLDERINVERPGHEAWLLFRVGRSRTPARSARRTTEDILT